MARCPFATWDEINGDLGAYAGGPFKIVHHTTEGNSYAGARSAYSRNKSEPHFTVAGSVVHQHIDTERVARSLKNKDGGVQTNRDSAVQIEVVAFAGRPKDPETLAMVAQLCRWIESTHSIPQAWPNGFPRWSHTGRDPKGHNRDPLNWDAQTGHFGHSQVPENRHWDPGYTPAEVQIVTPDAITLESLLEQVTDATGWTAATWDGPRTEQGLYDLADTSAQLVAQLVDSAAMDGREFICKASIGDASIEIRVGLRAEHPVVGESTPRTMKRSPKKRRSGRPR